MRVQLETMKTINSRKAIVKFQKRAIQKNDHAFGLLEDTYSDYVPFFNVDKIDLEGMRVKSRLYGNDYIRSNRYLYAYYYHKEKYKYSLKYEQFLEKTSSFSAATLIDILKDALILSLDLEAILLFASLKSLGYLVDDYSNYVIKTFDDECFYKDLLAKNHSICFFYENDQQLRLYGFLNSILSEAGFVTRISNIETIDCDVENCCFVVLPKETSDSIYYPKGLFKRANMFYRNTETLIDNSYCFFFGDYISFLENVYKTTFKNARNAETKISIVIPVKSIDENIFKETLLSCLNQNYDNYEVLISVNTNDDHEIKKILDTINCFGSDKIRCVFTPFQLKLSKSFEYAFLNAKGEYIISIGADDALVPTALQKIGSLLEERENDIFMWDIALFFWPSKGSTKPFFRYTKKDRLNIDDESYVSTIRFTNNELLSFVLGKKHYLGMPNFYLKTCFKKTILFELIDSTGKLFDGISQDLYTGIYNILSNKDICLINDILVIAGTSENSFGKQFDMNSNISDVFKKSKAFLCNYRYKNLFPNDHAVWDFPYGYSNDSVCITEYLKICSLLGVDNNINNKQYLGFVSNLYSKIPYSVCDKGIFERNLVTEILKKGGFVSLAFATAKRIARSILLKHQSLKKIIKNMVNIHKKKTKSNEITLEVDFNETINSKMFEYND